MPPLLKAALLLCLALLPTHPLHLYTLTLLAPLLEEEDPLFLCALPVVRDTVLLGWSSLSLHELPQIQQYGMLLDDFLKGISEFC